MLSSSMGTELRCSDVGIGRVGRFSRSAKVQELPASRSSSELSAHQMTPSGVIAHWRGHRALEPMEIFSSVQRRARSTPLRDGDSEPRRLCWTFSSCSLVRLSLVSLFMAYSRPSFLVTPLLGVMFCLLWQLWYAVSTLRRPATQLFSDLQLCRQYCWPSSTLSRGRRPRAPSQGTVFCAGPFVEE